MRQLEGKVALVTGASSGIGRATAIAMARAGAKVVVTSRGAEGNAETVSLIQKDGGEALAIRTDVTKTADVEAMVRGAVERFGRLDVAFDNASTSVTPGPVHEYSEDEWDTVLETHLKSVWRCMKYELRQMLAQGGGAIVNMSSMSGRRLLRHGPCARHGFQGPEARGKPQTIPGPGGRHAGG